MVVIAAVVAAAAAAAEEATRSPISAGHRYLPRRLR